MVTWKEINEDVWGAQDGDAIEGVVVDKIPQQGETSARYYLDTVKGQVMVWGTAVLDSLMRYVEIGQLVRITYKGKKDIDKNQQLKIYKVEKGEQ